MRKISNWGSRIEANQRSVKIHRNEIVKRGSVQKKETSKGVKSSKQTPYSTPVILDPEINMEEFEQQLLQW
jgi:hypothetical protein